MTSLFGFVPKGVTDLYGEDIEFKEQILWKLKTLFRNHGYKPVEPPAFEYYDLFSKIQGSLEMDQMVKVIDTDGKILVLRPDATIPIARMAAARFKDARGPQKFSYVTHIFQMNDDAKDICSREVTQAGIELFDRGGVASDVEVISLAIESLKLVGLDDFTLDVGQANFYKTLIGQIHLSKEEIRHLQKLIADKNVAELKRKTEDLAIPDEYKKALFALPTLFGDPERVFKKALAMAVNEELKAEIAYLQDVFTELAKLGYEKYLSVDLGLINRLNYYTKILFQGYIPGYGKPVLLGGRYDDLPKQFGCDARATGFAVYVDDFIAALNGRKR